jgi:TolB protein
MDPSAGNEMSGTTAATAARTALRLAAALGLLAVLLGPWACFHRKGSGNGPLDPAMPMVRPAPSAEAGLPSIPQSSATMLGKPYRDLHRHTTHKMGEVSGIDVSPDGSTLLYSSTQDGPTPNLYLKRENGAGVVRKTSGPYWDIHPKYSPDGRWIAFASNRDGNFDIWIIPAEGASGMEQVSSSADDEVHPTWSPDGKKIALSRLSGTHGWNIWILDREDQSVVELGPGLFPEWSPTGEWIVFQKPSEREPRRFGIWIIRPDSSEVRQVVAGDDFYAVDPAWSPAGDLLAFAAAKDTSGDARRTDGGRIWLVELTHGKMYRITDGPGTDASPVWGLGGRLYFISDRLDSRSIWSLLPPEVKR